MSFKYDRIQSKSGGVMEMKYDSNVEGSEESLLGMQLAPLVEPVISMKITKNGNTSITGGTEQLPEALKLQVEEAMKSLSSASGFPEGPVDNGDSWEDTLTQQQGGVTVIVDTSFGCKKRLMALIMVRFANLETCLLGVSLVRNTIEQYVTLSVLI